MTLLDFWETCFYVADADDPIIAREEVGRLIVRILEGLRVKGGQTVRPASELRSHLV